MNPNSLIHKPEPLRKYLLHKLGSINNNCFYLAQRARTPQADCIMGRKKIPLAKKRINFSVTLSPETQKIIEKNTKNTTRSAFIEKTIKHFDGRRERKRIQAG